MEISLGGINGVNSRKKVIDAGRSVDRTNLLRAKPQS
uniref:Uncharacterized protein n=1 Tax=Erwinia amylovora ATCC BAA-2158 TaxID=889211 RepID=E5B3Z4_ERWAM|nr:hypothetical protein predicted by Glimmer/Critica [Erwinia amylovora ATCC BAA-2158]